MKSRLLSLVAVLVPLLSASGAQGAPPPGAVPDQYVVVLENTAADPQATASEMARQYDLALGHTYRYALKGFVTRAPVDRVEKLAADPRVRSVVADNLMAFDLVAASDQTLPTGVDRIQADRSRTWAAAPVDVDVAIIDSGIDAGHPDLNVAGGYDCTSKNPDAWADDAGHGTAMAGVLGAKNDATGVVGVAPGARLWAVKVGDAKGAKTSDVVCGLDWVAGRSGSIKVASMSLSGPGADDGSCGTEHKDVLHQAVCAATAAGVTLVASAGNGAEDLASSVPAAYGEVLTVTAMADYDGRPGGGAAVPAGCGYGDDDAYAPFSNFAVDPADAAHTIAAPGVCILTTAMGGGYRTVNGTSPATPHVAGTAALCLAGGACAGLSPAQVAAKLRADAAAQRAASGFVGDPGHPVAPIGRTRYYGYLVHAGSY